MQIHNLVQSLVNRFHTRNPFELAQESNAIIVYAPLVDIRGFYQHFKRNNIIYIKDDLPENEKKFVCAHELGHMLLHKKSNAVFMDSHTLLNTSKYEQEADLFAIELLIPDEVLIENCNYTTAQLGRLLAYDKNLIELRLELYRSL